MFSFPTSPSTIIRPCTTEDNASPDGSLIDRRSFVAQRYFSGTYLAVPF
ncbi:hypothetical protein [uncultured Fibrella sp.]